jgi:hypothetical protein
MKVIHEGRAAGGTSRAARLLLQSGFKARGIAGKMLSRATLAATTSAPLGVAVHAFPLATAAQPVGGFDVHVE